MYCDERVVLVLFFSLFYFLYTQSTHHTHSFRSLFLSLHSCLLVTQSSSHCSADTLPFPVLLSFSRCLSYPLGLFLSLRPARTEREGPPSLLLPPSFRHVPTPSLSSSSRVDHVPNGIGNLVIALLGAVPREFPDLVLVGQRHNCNYVE